MKLETIGVVGLGLLGRGIVAALLGRGFQVVAVGTSADDVQLATRDIVESLQAMIANQVCDASMPKHLPTRFEGVTTTASLARCDFVIESVTEDSGVKNEVLSQIEDVVATHTPIATNTSAIPIRELQANRSHPERLIGMHWAEPAYATRFMELICGEATNRETVRMTRDLAERCEKDVCVIAKDVPGFIANRLGYAMIREALNLVEMGVADAETIDRSFRNSIGLWAGFCGPFRWIDITGGPELYAKAMAPVWPTLSNADTPTPMSRNANKDGDEQSHHSGMFPWHRGDTADWEAAFHRHAWRVYHAAKRQGSGESKS